MITFVEVELVSREKIPLRRKVLSLLRDVLIIDEFRKILTRLSIVVDLWISVVHISLHFRSIVMVIFIVYFPCVLLMFEAILLFHTRLVSLV